MTFTSTSTSTTRRTAFAVVAAALSITVGLTGCSGSSNGTANPTSSAAPTGAAPSSSSAPITNPSIKPTKAQNKIPPDNKIVEVPALRKTIALTSCVKAPGGWSGVGTAKNTSKKTETYHLLVFFTDKYSRTIDFARTTVTVAPGRTKQWKAARKFTPPAGTQCVLRGLYQS